MKPGPVLAPSGDVATRLRAALPRLRADWPIRSLALFGSRIRQDATEASDLDVLVEFDRPVPLSAAALKPHIGAHIRAEAVPL